MVVLVGSTGPACASVFGYACRLVCCGECRRHFEAASECSRRCDRLLDPSSATRRNGVRGNGKGGIYICSAYSYLEGGRNVCQIRDLILETLQSIMTSDHRGFPDETSGRGVSIDDAWQGRSPAEHPPSLRTTLLPITIDVSRDVRQGSEPSIRRASRELQLQRESSHHAHSTGRTAQAMARSLWASGELGLS